MTLNLLLETGWISTLILTLTFVCKSFDGCTNDILEFTCELNQVRHFKKVLVELPVRLHVGFIDGQASSLKLVAVQTFLFQEKFISTYCIY